MRAYIEFVAMVLSAIALAISILYAVHRARQERPAQPTIDREQEAVNENAAATPQWQGITTQADPLDVIDELSEGYDMLAPVREDAA